MRAIPLTAQRGGINRQRIKGGARADTLYDLVNGYVTDDQTIASREGSRRDGVLNSATKGICSFDGSLYTFAASIVAVPEGFTLQVIAHPDSTADNTIQISKIHFAAPFLGFLYVVAEFANGDIFQFWLRSSGAWQADTAYSSGDVIEPTTPNGLAYQATRISSPFPSWAPNVPRAEGDIVEPTVYNDFYYEVVDTIGDAPRSGNVEPIWPTEDGAQVVEDVNGVPESTATATPPPPTDQNPQEVTDRYEL